MTVEINAQLQLLAEIAATYTGFIAVFIVFTKRDGKFSPTDQHFVQAMIISCMVSMVAALVPGTMFHISGNENWPTYSAIALCNAAFLGLYIGRHQYKMYRDGTDEVHWFWHVPGIMRYGSVRQPAFAG